MSHHVSKSDFARMAGVNPSTIARMAPKHFSGAMVGKRVDAAHPEAVAYLEGRGIDVSQFKPADPKPVGDRKAKGKVGAAAKKDKIKRGEYNGPAETDLQNLPDDIRKLAELPMIEVIEMFGSDVRLKDWADANLRLENLHEKRLKNAEREGELVHRGLISSILEPIESFHVRLLTDGSKKISQRCFMKFGAGATIEDMEQLIKLEISKFIKPMKAQIQRKLENGR